MCGKYENINYTIYSDSGFGLQLHSQSSPGERNGKFSQNGKLSQNRKLGQNGKSAFNVSSSAIIVGVPLMAATL